jgi:hypothetical protein
MEVFMTIDNLLHMIAGTFVVLSVTLGYFISPYFYIFTAFVGVNLIQSAFSGWCPMMTFLRWMGFREA